MVTISSNEVNELGLENSIEDPHEPDKMVYFMAAYHHVHCMVSPSLRLLLAMRVIAPWTSSQGLILA